jgi:hypothetical protein
MKKLWNLIARIFGRKPKPKKSDASIYPMF